MSVFTVASRYAKSLIDLSKEQGNLDAVKNDMEQFIAIVKESSELAAVLKNPIIKQDKKRSILSALFDGKVEPSVMSFFHMLVAKGRAGILNDVAIEFLREYRVEKGIVQATVTSAVPLSEENLSLLKTQIASEIKAKEVVLNNKVDKALIGGFVIKVGDRQVDVSIAGRLNKLEKHFAANVI
ncbi:ATP synthase F1 subunit delta [Sphingobacterium sp. lm-10]|uniref:ATP synthase F1 subunit delta n=1 Tax=Sphingobacterium sp. lm-10 TaxID=2944904 RepID=UPI00201FB765|nr:ATP synthase F1 subunit delta [Sphingobacterium sp. lm-10]MCL7986338.1 ATP synthase F1 subunit delta [Sphingobacterium sp. lm-10]